MDISSLGSAISSAKLESEIGTRVAKKTLDAQKQQGEAAVKQIAAAAELSNDLARDSGRVDTYA